MTMPIESPIADRLFVDSFFLIALLNPGDKHHALAVSIASELGIRQCWTTEWVLLETANVCRMLAVRSKAAELVMQIRNSASMTVVSATQELFQRALAFFREQEDKEWTLTDCLSFIVMKDNDIQDALTGHYHFRQAGRRPVM
jgi:predicted nucleic acid-binding protein